MGTHFPTKLSTLLGNGRYRDAIEACTKQLHREESEIVYAGRAEAYFNLKDYDRALADFQSANAVATDTSTDNLERIGVVNWLARREYTAAGTWLDLVLACDRGKIDYADAAGGVEPGCLLWFAAVRLEFKELLIPARRLLEKKVAAKGSGCCHIDNWPGPIAMFLLGMLDEPQLREKIIEVPIARERELCQAEFYVAVKALQDGDPVKAKLAFRKAAALHDASIENEYDLAQRESRRRAPIARCV